MPAARASCWAAVGREGPPLVIAPPAEDLQVARGESLTPEAAAPDEADRGAVAGVDVRLQAVQAELTERVAGHESDALAHIAFDGHGHGCLVPGIGTPEIRKEDLAHVDHAGNRSH